MNRLFAISVHQIRYAGNFDTLISKRHEVFTGNCPNAEIPGPCHQMLQTNLNLLAVAINTDSSQRYVVDFLGTNQILDFFVTDEDLLNSRPNWLTVLGSFLPSSR